MRGDRLIQLGVLLFFLGLLTGVVIPALENPRMGLASHLEAILNGLFLVVLGLVWPRLSLAPGAERAAFGLVLYGTFANWAATLLAAAWGAGSGMMPLSGGGMTGSAVQEGLITALLVSLSLAMVAATGLVLWGLRRPTTVGGRATA